jgi:hypothetical protein
VAEQQTAPAAVPLGPALVPVAVSRRKLEREIAEWDAQQEQYVRRGWRLRRVGDLQVEVLFLATVPVDPQKRLTVVAPSVLLSFDDYDLLPPSVRFVDPFTGGPVHPGLDALLSSEHGDRNVLVNPHPRTGLPFLCLPGVREYHQHPQHSGDDWLLHRARGEGRLAVICERLWRAMPRTLVGMAVQSVWTPPVSELRVRLVQGKPEELQGLAAQMEAAQQAQDQQSTMLSEQGLRLSAQYIDETGKPAGKA